jgi:hypothetical protein
MEEEKNTTTTQPEEHIKHDIKIKKDKPFNWEVVLSILLFILLITCVIFTGMQQKEINELKSDNLKLQSNAIGLSLCNDGFTKCAGVLSQCKQYIGSITNTTQFNYKGQTNISQMNPQDLPFGIETVYTTILDNVLFER